MSSPNQKKVSYSYHRKLKKGKEELVKNNLPAAVPSPDGNRLLRRKKASLARSRRPEPHYLSVKHTTAKEKIQDRLEYYDGRHKERKINELAEVLARTGDLPSKKLIRNRKITPDMILEIKRRAMKLIKKYAKS